VTFTEDKIDLSDPLSGFLSGGVHDRRSARPDAFSTGAIVNGSTLAGRFCGVATISAPRLTTIWPSVRRNSHRTVYRYSWSLSADLSTSCRASIESKRANTRSSNELLSGSSLVVSSFIEGSIIDPIQVTIKRKIKIRGAVRTSEVKILCNRFGVSLDALLSPTSEMISFRHQAVDHVLYTFEHWLKAILEKLEMISAFPEKEKEIVYYAKDMPVFYYFTMPELSAFKMFFWMKTALNYPEYQKEKFRPEIIPKEYIAIGKRIWSKYSQLFSTELWSDETLNVTLKQVEYYLECGYFLDPKDPELILDQFAELVENARKMGAILKDLGAQLQAKHPSVGAVRSIGLFGIVELIRSRKTRQPMAPFNGTSEEMAALGRFFRENGLYTLVRWNTFYTNPPLCINEQQLREAMAIIDKGLEIADKAVVD